VLSDEIGWNNKENHGVLKGLMVGQWGTKFYVIELCVVKWYCDRLMYNFVKEMILNEFS